MSAQGCACSPVIPCGLCKLLQDKRIIPSSSLPVGWGVWGLWAEPCLAQQEATNPSAAVHACSCCTLCVCEYKQIQHSDGHAKNMVPSRAGPRSKARLVMFSQTHCFLLCRSRRNLKLASSTPLQHREDQPFPMRAVERKGQMVLQHWLQEAEVPHCALSLCVCFHSDVCAWCNDSSGCAADYTEEGPLWLLQL